MRVYPASHLSHLELRISELMVNNDYLIATDLASTEETVAHELAHAQWAIEPAYNKRARRAVNLIALDARKQLERGLTDFKYPNVTDILHDEIHAYLLTANEIELREVFPKMPINALLDLAANFKGAMRRDSNS